MLAQTIFDYGALYADTFINNAFSNSTIKTSDGNFFSCVAAKAYTPISLVKFDTSINVIWTKHYVDSAVQPLPNPTWHGYEPRKVVQLKDESYLILANIDSIDTISQSAKWSNDFIIKTDKNGNFLWGQSYSFDSVLTNTNIATNTVTIVADILPTADSGFVIAGINAWSRYTHFVKCDAQGNVLWANYFSFTPSFYPTKILSNRDGYMLYGIAATRPALMQIDSSGKPVYIKRYNIPCINCSVTSDMYETRSGGYILSGYHQNSANNYSPFLIRTDSAANLLWYKLYNALNYETIYSGTVAETKNKEYVQIGQTMFSGVWNMHYFLTDSAGNLKWSRIGNPTTNNVSCHL